MSFIRLLSSAVVLWFTSLSLASAHEVLPSIADMTKEGNALVFEVRANVESFVAGIDLNETADTNDTPQAQDYDALRALEPAELEEAFMAYWPQMAAKITVNAGDARLPLSLDRIEVGPVGNIDAVRTSAIRFRAALPEGAETVTVGWTPDLGVLVLRQMGVDAPYDGYLEQGAVTDPISLAGGDQATGWQSFLRYIPVGFDHIVPKGLDHILFVLGLFFLSAKLRPLLLQVTLFTLAHTITLALAALGYTAFIDDFFQNQFGIEFIAVVEPLIALSIVYVAVENIVLKGISPWRPFLIFGFGLLHGLGFASVLGEFGLPEASFIAALIGFNVGVEVGQLAVIAVMFLCVWQALRIDWGKNEVSQGFAIYAALLFIGLVLLTINSEQILAVLAEPGIFLDSSALLLALSITIVAMLCLVSISQRDQIAAYRRFVAIPCSGIIAIIGAYWVIERVFL